MSRETIPEGAAPQLLSREEFVRNRFTYKPGEHVSFLGPTGSGKTTLAMQLLEPVARPSLPVVVMEMKPKDSTMTKFATAQRLKTVRTWPPTHLPLSAKPRGWVLWPKHTFDPETDDAILRDEFLIAIRDSYRRGNRILFVDELYGVCEELKLERPCVTVWSRGRSMGCGLWGGTQRPAHVPLWAYSQASHLFLAHEPDQRARKRYAEIGGIIDPAFVEYWVLRLKKHQWLYIGRDGPHYCIVDA